MSSERVRGLVTCAVTLAAFTACELSETELAPVPPRLVVHSVLSPSSASQVLLLERSWDGDKYIYKTGKTYSQFDPIVGGGGYGEINAVVDVTLPDGSVQRATEARLLFMSPYGAGVYLLRVVAGAESATTRAVRLR